MKFSCELTIFSNLFILSFSETLFRRISDEMVSQGYKDKGYEYIIIDDCWVDTKRDSNDEVFPDLKRFPNGMKSLADYVSKRQ